MSSQVRPWVHAFIIASSLAVLPSAGAQELPPIFEGTPRHIVAAHTVAAFPKPSFLENLVVTDEGLVVTSHEDGRLIRIVAGKAPHTLIQLPGKITGVASHGAGGFVLTAFDGSGNPVVHLVSRTGRLSKTLHVEGGIFLNGIERVGRNRYLIADSYLGVIWSFDSTTLQFNQWLRSPLLERLDVKNPLPAANGIRRDGDSVLVSNTARMTLVRVPFRSDGSAGEPTVWKEEINVDDFAVLPDRSILAATHLYNSVVRIDPQGRVEVIAEAAQGLTGSTSVALSKDGKTAYVTTNGGIFLPPASGVEDGRVVALTLPW